MSSRFLQQLRREQSLDKTGQSRQLYYLLAPPLGLELAVACEQPNGRLDAIQPYRPQAGHLRQPPPFLAEEDVALLSQLIEADSNWLQSGRGEVADASCLQQMLATGRARNAAGQRLAVGPPRTLSPGWRIDEHGRQQLGWAAPEHVRVLPVSPPAYWDLASGRLGPVEPPPSAEALAWLRQPPLIEADAVAGFIESRGAELKQSGLPLPSRIRLEIQDSPPQPHLHLYRRTGARGASDDCLRLQFRYSCADESTLFDHADPEVSRQVFSAASTTLYRVQRKPEAEAEWEQALYLALEACNPQPLSGAEITFAQRSDWRQVTTTIIPALKRQGWSVSVADNFRHNFVRADRIELAAQWLEKSWFELALNVAVEGEALPLLPLLADCARRYSREQLLDLNADSELPLTLPDGRRLLLPVARLLHWLDLLVELVDEDVGQEVLRLPASQLHRLQTLAADGVARNEASEALLDRAEQLASPPSLEGFELPDDFTAALRAYQRLGVAWLQQRRQLGVGGILADDMGLGKTVQTLAHLCIEQQAGRLTHPALVVAPTSVLHNWRQEAQRFAPRLRCAVLHGAARHELWRELADYDLVLTSYALLTRDIDQWQQQPLSAIILDEAQAIKNPRSQAARHLRRLDAPYKLCLTGTPLENHLGELWSLFEFLMPRFLDSEQSFNRRFRKPIEKDSDQARARTLMDRISPFLLRRTKEQVATDLPPKTEVVVRLPLPEVQAELYETLRQQSVASLSAQREQGDDNEARILILNALMQLRQVCCDPGLVDNNYRNAESAKREHLLEMLQELVDEGRAVLVFSQFTRMLDLLAADLQRLAIPFVMLTGASRNREQLVMRFQAGEVPVFLISLKAGGTGLNLTRADTVIHYDPWWNSAAEAQATDRAYRIGQSRPVFVYKLLAENTVEEKIHALQSHKRELLQQVYDVAEARTRQLALDNASLLALLE